MKKRAIFIFSLILFFAITSILHAQKKQSADWYLRAVHNISDQLVAAAKRYKPGHNPRSLNPDGSVRCVNYTDWTTGFFPGSLWYGYELTGDQRLAEAAKRFTLALDSARYITNTHDVGFMLYSSYGNAYRITKDIVYLPALREGARHLAARFNPKVGAIRSWDFAPWHYPVIIDNMVNLEYLYWAAKMFKRPNYTYIASTHALTTMKNHFRKDYSSYHVVDYDAATGKVLAKKTHQGLSDRSAWSRGQAWGLYGYAMCYQHTKDDRFLTQAKHIAAYIMNNPHTPKDKIPVWDYDVHNAMEPDDLAPRDASAAAIIASALLELSTEVPNGQKYFDYAEVILKNLSSNRYLAEPGTNGLFILKHSTGALLYNSEVDTAIDYADYYFLEALKRYKEIRAGKEL